MVLRCCCSVADGLRWCCGSVAVVPSLVSVYGAVGGPRSAISSLSSGRSGGWSQPVRLMVQSGQSAMQSVVWSVCGPVRAVCGPVETRPVPYSIQRPAGFKCLDIGRASGLSLAADSGCCGGAAVLLRCRCSVAVLLRWCCRSVALVPGVSGPTHLMSDRWSGRWSGWWSGWRSGRLSGH